MEEKIFILNKLLSLYIFRLYFYIILMYVICEKIVIFEL